MNSSQSPAPSHEEPPPLSRRVQLALVTGLRIVMAIELALLVLGEQWLHAFLVTGVIAATLAPSALKIDVPPEIQIAVVIFVFATLFLGEVRGLLRTLLVVGSGAARDSRAAAWIVRFSHRLHAEPQ